MVGVGGGHRAQFKLQSTQMEFLEKTSMRIMMKNFKQVRIFVVKIKREV